jgi:hypothetical protein
MARRLYISCTVALPLAAIGLGACSKSKTSWTEFRSTFAPEVVLVSSEERSHADDQKYMNECDSAYYDRSEKLVEDYAACVGRDGDANQCWTTCVANRNELETEWLKCIGE